MNRVMTVSLVNIHGDAGIARMVAIFFASWNSLA